MPSFPPVFVALMDPAAERDQAFRDDWLRYFEPDEGSTDEMRKYILVDPASSKKKGRGEERMSVSILVVDDELDVAEMFRQRFREARNGTYVMHFANSGEEALDKLAVAIEPPLIVILSDINMPVMDGLELLREIKTRRPDLPEMMVTAYGDDERRRQAGEYCAAEFITKPVDFDFLKTKLRDLFDAAD